MAIEHVQTRTEIQQALHDAGLHPRKRFGQHFLIDGNLMRALVRAAEIQDGDIVIEVGPGTGGLTDLLVRRRCRVILMEIDRDLHAILVGRFTSCDNVTILCGDALESKHRIAAPLAAHLTPPTADPSPNIKLVANLPYQVATPLVLNILLGFPKVTRLCFAVQAEVGQRMVSPPGGKSYGPLAVIAQCLSDVHIVTRIPPSAFWPQPTIESVMIRMDRKPPPESIDTCVKRFGLFVRSVFDHRRKTLRAALRLALENMNTIGTPTDCARDAVREPLGDAIARAGAAFDLKRRPESLEVGEWINLFQTVR
ncbi:MAG: 16S rRNA (adenine(1518)-N(6)/adenine(1519)-N(6))-dimethyltransferase RsmA [Phycisphaerae bacterium]